jgi:hypothetical protein
MSDDKYIYHPFKQGQNRPTVKILLRKRRGRGATGEGEAEEAGPTSGVMPTGIAPDELVPARQHNISFHDWATRLRNAPNATAFDGLRFRPTPSTTAPVAGGEDKTSEYVEIAFEALGTFAPDDGTLRDRVELSPESFAALDRALLGSRAPVEAGHEDDPRDPVDPFGFGAVNGSGRRVPTCLDVTRSQIGVRPNDEPDDNFPDMVKGQVRFFWFPKAGELTGGPEWYDGDVIYVPGYYINPTTALRPVIFDKYDDAKEQEVDEDERWNPLNVTYLQTNQGAKVKQRKVKQGGPGLAFGIFPIAYDVGPGGRPGTVFTTVGIDGQGIGPDDGMYEGFVTTDKVRFKVTNEPRFDAAEVTYTFRGNDNRVYLRPVMRPWVFAAHDEEGHISDVYRAWASRLPIYPYRY